MNTWEHGGTAQAAACFGVDEHNVVKTLIMQDEHEKPLVILMHGDREVSTKNLARQTNRKHIEPCKPAIAEKIPAIKSGEPRRSVQRRTCRSTSKKQFWVCRLFISTGGRRGYNVKIDPKVLKDQLGAVEVECAIEK